MGELTTWIPLVELTAPENTPLDTKIDLTGLQRFMQPGPQRLMQLIRQGNVWLSVDDRSTFSAPTHWKYPNDEI